MLEQFGTRPRLVMRFIAVLVPVAFLGTTLFASDNAIEEQAQIQPEPQKEIRTDKLVMTKCHLNDKTFYYIQFLKQEQEELRCEVLPEGAPVSEKIERVWLTIQLGYIADRSEGFVVSDTLYTNLDGIAFTDTVQRPEFEQHSDQIFEAIGVTEARYETKILTTWLKFEQWLDDRAGPAPMVKEDDVTVLQELYNLKMQLSKDRSTDSASDALEATPTDADNDMFD